MDDLLYIQTLLDRFDAAETTEEEERRLTDYFARHDDVPAAWAAYAVMFRGFHAKAYAKVCAKAGQEGAPRVAAAPAPHREHRRPADGTRRRPLLWTVVTTATAAVIAGVFLLWPVGAPTEATMGHDLSMVSHEGAATESNRSDMPAEKHTFTAQEVSEAKAEQPAAEVRRHADKSSEEAPPRHAPLADVAAAEAPQAPHEAPHGTAIEDAVINALIQQAEAERQAVNQVIDDILYDIDLSTKPTICAL